jgi:hypothetical protein
VRILERTPPKAEMRSSHSRESSRLSRRRLSLPQPCQSTADEAIGADATIALMRRVTLAHVAAAPGGGMAQGSSALPSPQPVVPTGQFAASWLAVSRSVVICSGLSGVPATSWTNRSHAIAHISP